MPLLLWIIFFTALGGALSALAASIFLLAPEKRRAALLPHLVSFATGALLGAALLGLLPHAVESAGVTNVHSIGLTLLFGILIFFLLEKFVLWRHCHVEVCEGHEETHQHATISDHQRDAASARLVLLGDGFHNALDGVLIAAAFMTDVHLGIVTAVAVIVHEIPQEVGDLAILLHGGMSRGKALLLNLLTSLTSVFGGVIAYFALGTAVGSSAVHGVAGGVVLAGALWLVLGYVFYCTAYAAAGSLITRQADAYNASLPLQLPLIVGYVLAYTVVYSNGVYWFYHLLGFIPFTAPVVMPVLVAVGAAPAWQIAVSVAITLASTVAMARLAGRIYGRAILRTGTRLRARQVLREAD